MKKIDFIQHHGDNKKDIERVGRSLFCFSKDNCLRRVCFKIVNHRWYDVGVPCDAPGETCGEYEGEVDGATSAHAPVPSSQAHATGAPAAQPPPTAVPPTAGADSVAA